MNLDDRMNVPANLFSFETIHRLLLAPRSQIDDLKRREFIINVLLLGLIIVAVLRLVSSTIHHQPMGFDQEEDALIANGLFLLVAISLWSLSRRGYQLMATYGLLGLLSFAAIQLTLRWSFELPIGELMYALVVVVAGILLKARAALAVTGLTSIVLLGISYAQISHHLHPKIDWANQDFQMADVIGYVTILCLIALVSWLTNREVNRSLLLAKASELALAKERDSLEIKVAERTHELEQAQKQRTVELQRFAEFGRVSANLLHEIANPLTAASINLELLDDKKSKLVISAQKSLQQLDRYLAAARNQLKTHAALTTFSVNCELRQIARIMTPLACKAEVKLSFSKVGNYKLYGDPVKFNQLVANLVVNALDAYADANLPTRYKRICVTLTPSDQWLELRVTDWGAGIKSDQLPHLFEHFYTTKVANSRGTGLGLAIVKRIVEDDFQGSISASSSPSSGTLFTVKLKRPQKGAKLGISRGVDGNRRYVNDYVGAGTI